MQTEYKLDTHVLYIFLREAVRGLNETMHNMTINAVVSAIRFYCSQKSISPKLPLWEDEAPNATATVVAFLTCIFYQRLSEHDMPLTNGAKTPFIATYDSAARVLHLEYEFGRCACIDVTFNDDGTVKCVTAGPHISGPRSSIETKTVTGMVLKKISTMWLKRTVEEVQGAVKEYDENDLELMYNVMMYNRRIETCRTINRRQRPKSERKGVEG